MLTSQPVFAPSTCGHCRRNASTGRACGRSGPSHDVATPAAVSVPPAAAPAPSQAPPPGISSSAPSFDELPDDAQALARAQVNEVALHEGRLRAAEARHEAALSAATYLTGEERAVAWEDRYQVPAGVYERMPAEVQRTWVDHTHARSVLKRAEAHLSNFGGYLTGPLCPSPAEVHGVILELCAAERARRRTAVLKIQLPPSLLAVARVTSQRPWAGLVRGLHTGRVPFSDADVPDLVVVRDGRNEEVARSWCAPASFTKEEAELYRTLRRDGHSPAEAAEFVSVLS